MKTKPTRHLRAVTKPTDLQWKQYNKLEKFIKGLDQPKDAAEVALLKPGCPPPELLPMIF